jgi:excisionase family DNA binding protein
MNLLTIQEASGILRLSVPTLYRLTSQKRIPFYKVGGKLLFDSSKLTDWVSGFAVEPVRGMTYVRSAV